ncbi:dehydrogenase [Kaistia algarum]|uniref:NAD(P)H-dependent oxidoreductase n=1 Tax=Kaistia algarum TaxID=2083279 RepID=UPI000CE73C72|nr:NAD(P)H-dependent oxidoreductase [Kaistia algarum]MCX5512141.1 NAD(P)H-dependent oxidoreductase [Kaistia algarum]PPE80593.1 dehydrogenase [Kaistia algarum]
MAKKIVIIEGHPDPAGGHLCGALADAYAEGAMEAGHAVRRIRIASLEFALLRSQADFQHGEVPDSLKPASEAVLAADHIVFIFPLWLGTMPALVKGFLEQIFRPGIAFAYGHGGFPKKLLAGKSARLVVTMGMPAFLYRWYFGAHALRGMERNILNFVGIKPVRETLLGNVEGVDESVRKGWIQAMRELGGRAD